MLNYYVIPPLRLAFVVSLISFGDGRLLLLGPVFGTFEGPLHAGRLHLLLAGLDGLVESSQFDCIVLR